MQHQTPHILDLTDSKAIHIVGVGGAGMSAIALVLTAMGNEVTGSDASGSTVLDRLAQAGVRVFVGHDGENLPERLDAVAVSTAIADDNPEIVEARRRGIPVLRRADALTSIARTRRTIAVAGTHGKTTTTALLALALEAGGARPSWVVGGEIIGRGSGAHWDSGEWFVVEADESDGTFLELGAEAVVVTNIEPDHLEFYGSLDNREGAIDALHGAFKQFTAQATAARVVCLDDPVSGALAGDGTVTYGTNTSADYRIEDVEITSFESRFTVVRDGAKVPVRLPAPGLHNIRNATAALAMAAELGIPLEVAAAGLSAYAGVGRRFQPRGQSNGVTFVDDYAHLPTEVRAAIAAAKEGDWKRVVAVFQPHRYSRTAQVGADFGGAFDDADLLILTDIYSAGETARPGVDGTVVRNAVEFTAGHPPVTYISDRTALAQEVSKLLEPGDLCLTLGAGDITRLADEIQDLS